MPNPKTGPDATKPIIEIAILATPEATLSTVFGMNDLLASVGRDWSFVTEGVMGEAAIKPTIVSLTGEEMQTVNQGWLRPHRALTEEYHPDAICILEMFIDPHTGLDSRYSAEIQWLQRYWANGGVIATACTGALLLAEAGLLDGKETTSHWGFTEGLARRYPAVKVQGNRAFIATGEGQRLMMAGGGTTWMDLGLYLIARFIGTDEAIRIAKLYLVEWHESSQHAFSYLCSKRQNDDAVIAESQVWLAQNYDQSAPVNAAIKNSGLSERSYIRRFKNATGMTPIEYILNLRIEEAKQLLETTTIPIEAVAETVGYQDASFFNLKFQKKVGLTPAQYRRKFLGLRELLRKR